MTLLSRRALTAPWIRRRWAPACLAGWLLAGMAHAASLPAQVPTSPRAAPTSVRISGVVRDTLFQPIANVQVGVQGLPGRVTFTNERGRFDIDSVPVGIRQLLFSRAGYLGMTVEADVTPQGAGVVELVLEATPPLPGATVPGSLSGIVMDTLGQPIVDAMVGVVGGATEVRTDSLGRYVLPRAAARVQQIVRVRKLGLSPQLLQVMIPDGEPTRLTVTMRRPAQELGTVVVRGQRVPKRLEGFERRRRFGNGYYMTPEQVQRRNPLMLSDLLRTMAGVRISPNSRGQPTAFGRGQCPMNLVVDGMPIPLDESFPMDAVVNAVDVLAIEAYPDGATAPADLMMGARAGGCGVIVVTTK